ncbi:hypothetical protein GC102_21500 [Paenibacillus sp. LMG 31460]|uniref:Uncharacterized protein n=1 Tax=Paenibacillus germinis TaxID=2654979 RepID=A0ABX1Z4X6_9BACL|nr:hypothetical protein [Paenibacillus germinis]NOU88316.1 hypothetical protein [Paenibacillus germinis]
MRGNITVYLRGGIYRLESPFELTEADSGRNGFQVTYRSYPSEEEVLDGSKVITGWQPHSSPIYKANIGPAWKFDSMFENNVRSVKARYPNTQGGASVYNRVQMLVAGSDKTKFGFANEDIPVIANSADVEAFVWPGGAQGFQYWFS